MKTLKYLLFAFVATLMTMGCSDDLEHIPGAPEQENYGVYFPVQRLDDRIELEPNHKTQVTYKVKRTNTNDAITVPVVVKANVRKIFVVEPIHFKEGESETTFNVYFPEAKIGVEYSCEIRIEDPRYISIYGNQKTGISFSVLRAGWRRLGVGKWRDDIISSLYGVPNPNAEIDVEIFEREDKKGYYRMKAFSTDLLEALFDVPGVPTEGKYTVIDATDPEKVWFPKQNTGLKITDQEGTITIASYVDKQFSIDASDSQYGTVKNGVITFPAQSIYCNLSNFMAADEWVPGNAKALHRIMLPGSRLYDYAVGLQSSESKNGVVNIKATFGKDAKMMKYAFFEGAVEDGIAGLHAQDIDAGLIHIDGELRPEENLDVTLEKTGIYTLVGAVYDAENKMQSYASTVFGYVAQGEEKPVILTIGLEGTNEMAGQGINTDNSVKFYAYGEDVTSMQVGFYRKDKIHGKKYEDLLNESGVIFSDEQLLAVNQKRFHTMFTGLNGDSEYVLVVRAKNGFVTEIKTAEYKTTGQFNPAMEDYTAKDFNMRPLPREVLSAITWNYYATNVLDPNPIRKHYGKVTFKSNRSTGMVDIYGLTTLTFDEEGQGVVEAQHDGTLMALNIKKESYGKVDEQNVTLSVIAEETPAYTYSGMGLILAGSVADGYIFFAANPQVQEQNNLTFSSILIRKGARPVGIMKDMLLVDELVDITKMPVEVLKSIEDFKQVAYESMTIDNYVELRGFDRLKSMIQNGMVVFKIVNHAKSMSPVIAPAHLKTAKATVHKNMHQMTGGLLQASLISTQKVELVEVE